MGLIVTIGEEAILDLIATNASWTAALFTSNTTPSSSDTYPGSYSLASFSGSAPIALTSWGSVTTSSGKGVLTHPTIQWTASSSSGLPQTCYGYIVYDGTGDLIWATRFSAAQTIASSGDFISLDITIDLFDSSLC